MADLFVSYARADKARVAPIVAALEAEGWSVWWDPEIAPGQEFDRLIAEELEKARAVVVVWTPTSVASRWVRGEAREAADRGLLAPVRFEGATLPIDLRAIHTTDLDRWSEDASGPEFKELARAVRALLGGAGEAASAKVTERKLSICVLPFANISGDPEQEYFSDGISEDIITDLSKVSALSVVARNNAFTLKGKTVEVQQIARQFGVSHVLEGSVRKAGNRVRITAQLIDGRAGDHLWAERWDRDLSDIFALQDEISQAVVAALKLKLLPEEKQAIEKRGTTDPEAFKLFLMARRYFASGSVTRSDLVVRLCRRAIDLDPTYARAWALIALAESARAAFSAGAADAGEAAADRAIELDPELAEAHAAKGGCMTRQGRYEEAEEEIEIALRLDPASVDSNFAAGNWALATGRPERAVRHFEAAAAADENDFSAPMMAVQCHQALGDAEGMRRTAAQAVSRAEKAIAAEPGAPAAYAFGVGALVVLGEIERAKAWAEHALLLDPTDERLRYNIACGMALAGETDYALDLLEVVLAEGASQQMIRWIEIDNDIDSLRGTERYQVMMAAAAGRVA